MVTRLLSARTPLEHGNAGLCLCSDETTRGPQLSPCRFKNAFDFGSFVLELYRERRRTDPVENPALGSRNDVLGEV